MCVIYTLCASDIATLLQMWVGHPHPNGHQFKVCLLTECACSKCEPQGGENMSAELSSHTSSFCFNHNKLQLFALALCAPLPTRQKTSLSSLIYKHKFACFCRAGALVCVVQATAPCCCVAGAQSAVARLSADLYCKRSECRSLRATN